MIRPKQYMVMFSSDEFCWPMGWDDNCDGALWCTGGESPAVIFPSYKAARKAVTISRRFAELEKAQGKTYNSDFVEGLKHIKIVPVVFAAESSPEHKPQRKDGAE